MEKRNKIQTSFRLPPRILERLAKQAEKEYQTMTALITRILNKELEQIEEEKK